MLQGGDVLLISCHTNWADEHRHDKSFVLLQPVPDSSPPKRSRMVIGVLLATGMVLTQIVGGLKSREYIHLWPAAVLTSALMLLTGCMNADQARKAIYWDVYLTIAAAFGVSAALEGTGVAASFANGIISIGKNLHSDGAALIASEWEGQYRLSRNKEAHFVHDGRGMFSWLQLPQASSLVRTCLGLHVHF